MSSPPNGHMDDPNDPLALALRRLEERLEGIENRLAQLESPEETIAPPQAHRFWQEPPVKPHEPLAPDVAPHVAQPPQPVPSTISVQTPEPVPTGAPAREESPRELETRMGLTWVNRIGVLTLVLGAAFFFKYAVDNQWIGESGRVALGVFAGFAILTLADVMWRRGHRIFAQGITAAGIAILYLSFYATFGFYHLFEQSVAFLLMALTTAMMGTLAVRYNSVAISVLALIGGYLTPVVLSTDEDHPWALFGYILLLNLGALAVARYQKWRVLEYLVLAGTALLYGVWFVGRFNPEKCLVATVYLFAFYALAWLVETIAILGWSQALANLALLVIWWQSPTPFMWLLLPLAAAGIVASERRAWALGWNAAAGFWLAAALWRSSLDRPGNLGEIALALTAGFLLFFGWIGWRSLADRAAVVELHLVVLLLNSAVYFGICYHLLNPDYHVYMGLFAVALAGIHLALGLLISILQSQDKWDRWTALFCVGVAICFLTLAVPIQFSGYRITMIWAAEAAALAWIGALSGAKRLTIASCLAFVLVLARLYAVDAWIYARPEDYSAVFNARFLAFFVTAVTL